MRAGQKTGAGRELRKQSTKPEQKLWPRLRNRQVNGCKFRRQHPLGPFVVDFCCIERALIVEIDGDVHAFQESADSGRQAYLEALGYRVVRFANSEVLENLDGVLEAIFELTK